MTLWLIAIAITVATLLTLIGCQALTYEQQRELALQAKGCFCEARGCEAVKSAAGQAAIAAAGGKVVQITEVRRPAAPEE